MNPRSRHAAFTLRAGIVALALFTADDAASGAATAADDAPPARRSNGFATLWRGPWDPRVSGGIWLDDAARRGFRGPSAGSRHAADVTSITMRWQLVFAAYAVPAIAAIDGQGSALDFAEISLVNTGAFLLSAGVTYAFKSAVGRERPYAVAAGLARMCDEPAHADDAVCRNDRNAAFLSGDAAASFTAAGLLCADRGFLTPTNSAWDGVICGAAVAGATTVSLLRIVADQHNATDLLAGAVVGVLSGFVVPVVLLYAPAAVAPIASDAREAGSTRDLGPLTAGIVGGLAVGGIAPTILAIVGHRRTPPTIARMIQHASIGPWLNATGGAGLSLFVTPF